MCSALVAHPEIGAFYAKYHLAVVSIVLYVQLSPTLQNGRGKKVRALFTDVPTKMKLLEMCDGITDTMLAMCRHVPVPRGQTVELAHQLEAGACSQTLDWESAMRYMGHTLLPYVDKCEECIPGHATWGEGQVFIKHHQLY
jgi:hypothetical protein